LTITLVGFHLIEFFKAIGMLKHRFLILLFLCNAAAAQVTISLQVPPNGILQKNQLWNFILISNTASSHRILVRLNFYTDKERILVFSANSRLIELGKGVKHVGFSEASPITYDYTSSQYSIEKSVQGLLPLGKFQACYSLIEYDGDKVTEIVSEDCALVEVDALSPPILNLPNNNDTITTIYPNFHWLPPAPLNLFKNLSFDLLLVEVNANQSDGEALQENIPIIQGRDLKNLVFNYPASNTGLVNGKKYAWRVVAKNNRDFVAQSEVSSFYINQQKSSIAASADYGNYLELKEMHTPSSPYFIDNGVIGVKFYSYDKAYKTNLIITSDDGKQIKAFQQEVIYGNNYFTYPIDYHFKNSKTYQVSLTSEKKVNYIATFRIK